MPFSNTNYYTENLINLEYVNSVFIDNDFTVEISDSFISLIDLFKNNKYYSDLTNNDKDYISLYNFTIIKKNLKNNIKLKSNILEFFQDSQIIKQKGSQELQDSGELEDSNSFSLDHLNNINNSNSILLLINTKSDCIIKNLISIFEEFNYKNKSQFKRNKNKIVKILGFENKHWIDVYNSHKKHYPLINYSSVILYDTSSKLDNNLYKYLIKIPIMPIVISTNNINVISINNDDLIYNNFNKIITNNSKKNIQLLTDNKDLEIESMKYYDLIKS